MANSTLSIPDLCKENPGPQARRTWEASADSFLAEMVSSLPALTVAFAPLFSKPVFRHAQVRLMGTILAPGRRTATAALRVYCGPLGGRAEAGRVRAVFKLMAKSCRQSLVDDLQIVGVLRGSVVRQTRYHNRPSTTALITFHMLHWP